MKAVLRDAQADLVQRGWYEAEVGSGSALSRWLGFNERFNTAVTNYLESRRVEPHYCKSILIHLLNDTNTFFKFRQKSFSGEITESEQAAFSLPENIGRLTTEAVQGKNILELGCRGGRFLGFLKQHGASEVFGVTSSHYADAARELIGVENVTSANVSDLTPRQVFLLKCRRPDLVLSTNLLEASRDDFSDSFKRFFLNTLSKLGGLNYIVPSVNFESTFTSFDFRPLNFLGWKHAGITFDNRTYLISSHFNMLSTPDCVLPIATHASMEEERDFTGTSYRFKLEPLDLKKHRQVDV